MEESSIPQALLRIVARTSFFVPFSIGNSEADPARAEFTEQLDVWHGHSIRLLPCAEQMNPCTQTQSLRKTYHLETDEILLRANDLLTQ